MVSRGRNKVGRGRHKVDRDRKGRVEVENDQVGSGRGRKYPLSPPPKETCRTCSFRVFVFSMQIVSPGRMSAGFFSNWRKILESLISGTWLTFGVSERHYIKLITILNNELDKEAEKLMHMNSVATEITTKYKLVH